MKGRKPVPIEQRQRNGNPGQRRIPEPVLVSGRPELDEIAEPPEHLHADAKEFWRDTVTRLVEVGIVDRVDTPVLEMLATQWARVKAAGRAIDALGYMVVNRHGEVVEHPAVRVEREATKLFMTMAEHYALTPIARTRLGLAELHRRSLQAEIEQSLGAPNLRPVEGIVVEG